MKTNFIPSLSIGKLNAFQSADLTGHLQKTRLVPDTQSVSFKDTLVNTLGKVNETMAAPDALMHESMTGGSVDVHDVMIANAKAEFAVTLTTSFVTKVVQAYDKVMQIQI